MLLNLRLVGVILLDVLLHLIDAVLNAGLVVDLGGAVEALNLVRHQVFFLWGLSLG